MSLLSFIFPRRCHLCNSPLPPDKVGEGELLCASCLSSLPRTMYHRSSNNFMVSRFAGLFPFERVTGHFFYASGSQLSELMQDLKYRRFRHLARYMGRVTGRELSTTGFLDGIDVILPVPMHYLKKARRGYNQTEEIAAGISEATGIPVCRDLRAIRPHSTQTSLSLEARRDNLRNVFALRAKHSLHSSHVLILDDVCTTGTTLAAAAETILGNAPDAKISMMTLGVTF